MRLTQLQQLAWGCCQCGHPKQQVNMLLAGFAKCTDALVCLGHVMACTGSCTSVMRLKWVAALYACWRHCRIVHQEKLV
jgi:hypothetical protein